MIFFFDGVENIVGKGENAGDQHTMFSKGFLLRFVKNQECVVRVNTVEGPRSAIITQYLVSPV